MNPRRILINTVFMLLALVVGLAGCAGAATEEEAVEAPVADPVEEAVEVEEEAVEEEAVEEEAAEGEAEGQM
jgi:Asp/Glu/hydantoin racemase